MNRERNNRTIKNLPDLFDEALELEDTSIPDPLPEEEYVETPVAETVDAVTADPTFFDEQVINVPIIDPPDMKNISSYPDTQIYDHLFSLDDDFLLDEEIVDDIVSALPDTETSPKPEAVIIPEIPVVPETPVIPETLIVPEQKIVSTGLGKKPGKKPPVKRAGVKKEEPVETPAAIEAAEPVRRKPRVKRAGEKAADVMEAAEAVTAAAIAAEDTEIPDIDVETFDTVSAPEEDVPPIALMNVGSPKNVAPKAPEQKASAPQKRPAGTRPAGKRGARPSTGKGAPGKPQRPKPEEMAEEVKSVPEEKPVKKKRPFSPLEKMKQKLAQKWS